MPIIDLSTTIEPNAETDISYSDHTKGAEQISAWLKVPSNLLKDGEGWAIEEFTRFSTHSCTHLDAPWHYNSKIKGERALTIDELPLEWFFNDGVVLDMMHKKDGDAVTVDDIEKELQRIEYELKPLDIVLIKNGQDKFYDHANYMEKGCGVSGQATCWLYEKGIRVMGIDAWGWDSPLNLQAEAANKEQKSGIFWQAHQCDIQYSQIERLVNLGPLPAYGFKIACFPLKIKGGSGAPARVVAIIPN